MKSKFDYDKLQDTLEYLKSVCEEAGACNDCPLGGKFGICKLGTSPKEWKPRHPDTHVFRVLE